MTAPTTNAQHLTVQCQFCQTWNRVDPARAGDRPKCGKCGRPILLDRPYPLNDESFARTINESDIPVMVDFYADWCGPCKMMAPLVDQLAASYAGRMLVTKVNTDLAQRVSQQYQIRGIPTTMIFDRGKPVAQQTGALPMQGLEQLIRKAGVSAA